MAETITPNPTDTALFRWQSDEEIAVRPVDGPDWPFWEAIKHATGEKLSEGRTPRLALLFAWRGRWGGIMGDEPARVR